ncbi:uncharacterized protein B0I36DRAFT_73321 [Microdochium trichocladiopsis]|uniref:Uncharacterized protein n=1 Tax=Microdochium trichocladiopsis TaxID=1682393 RepID=A0A9P9BYD9_9PEZI|nr:uncharacterized protein B0I36DRAFT_73321 [Microdochium trichocladiopsis]KAH7037963.1 hypothetical protein B0I36DRAFT_73321 [Microdochium trichocladiopsis]
MMTSKWWARLDKSKPEILKRIFKHPTLAPVLEKVVGIPGMRTDLQLGTWNKIFHCVEEVANYLLLIYDTWVFIMGSHSALEYVDSSGVQSLELLVPGVSRRDQLRAEAAIHDHGNFRCINDEMERTNILHRLNSVQHLIPSIRTLQNDFKYLRECTHVVKRLVCGKTPSPFTVQTIAWKAFKAPARHPATEEVIFENSLRLLYVAVMNDLCDLSGQTLLKDEGVEHEWNFQPDPRAWFRLACRAKQLGFVSEEILRLCQADPDHKIALKALVEARPSPDYDYGTNLEGLVQLIRGLFEKAHKVDFMETPRLLTTSQNGEPTTKRCGRLYGKAYARDRHRITADIVTCDVQTNTDVTSLFVRRSVFRAFWGCPSQDVTESFVQAQETASGVNAGNSETLLPPPQLDLVPVADHDDQTMAEDTTSANATSPAPASSRARRVTKNRRRETPYARPPQSAAKLLLGPPTIQGDQQVHTAGLIAGTAPSQENQQVATVGLIADTAPSEVEITILLRRNGCWVVYEKVPRSLIGFCIATLRAQSVGEQLHLYDIAGRGRELDDCTHEGLPSNTVCLSSSDEGFPLSS